MARTELPVTPLVANGALAMPAATNGNADGHYITDATMPEYFLLHVTVATAETDVTIKAGDYPPAIAAGYGDKVMALPVGVHFLGPFESGRYVRGDGRVHIDVETPANVTLRGLKFPKAIG